MTLTVLQIIPSLGTGGAEQACVDIVAALVARGDRALVVSSGGRRVNELEKAGGKHFLAQVQTKNPVQIIQNAFWLADIIRQEQVDVVHARSRAPAWSAKIACAMTGCRFITTFHAAYHFSNPIKKSYNRVMASADKVIAISDFIARHVRDHYGVCTRRLRVVNRGIDLSLYDPEKISAERKETLRLAWKIKDHDRIALLPARLSPIKGHKLAIEAIAKIKKHGDELPLLLVVGDDQGRLAYTQELEQMIDTFELRSHVRLVGACDDMAAAYALAELVLAPSCVPEGFGRVPVEAMAMGVPVIASKLGAMLDTVIEEETGWLLPHDDAALWAVKIVQALKMSPAARKKMGQNGRTHVMAAFDLQLMISKTLAVYDEK